MSDSKLVLPVNTENGYMTTYQNVTQETFYSF
jgi:hypothetical protein